MPDRQDKPGVGGPEQPPPRPSLKMVVGLAFAFNLATVGALLFDKCDLALIFAILALLFGGAVWYLVRDDQDKPGVGTREQPPP